MFEFDELTFITRRDWPDDDLYPETRAEMSLARTMYPELAHWSLSGLFNAACQFSQSILAAGWAWEDTRDEGFLAFCYVRQRWPAYDFGDFGWYQCEVWALGTEQPWLQSPLPPKPDWVSEPA